MFQKCQDLNRLLVLISMMIAKNSSTDNMQGLKGMWARNEHAIELKIRLKIRWKIIWYKE